MNRTSIGDRRNTAKPPGRPARMGRGCASRLLCDGAARIATTSASAQSGAGGKPADARVSQRDLDALSTAGMLYIATVRKDGNQSTAAPVWFTVLPNHLVLIQTQPTTWKAKRIRRGSLVIVWIGRKRGPAFVGKAEISSDPGGPAPDHRRLSEEIPDGTFRVPSTNAGNVRQGRDSLHRNHTGTRPARGVHFPARHARSEYRCRAQISGAAMANAAAIGMPCLRAQRSGTHAANALSASRFVLAAVWLAAFVYDDRRPGVLGPIALAAALSDFADGPVARQMRSADHFGRWLDSVADIAFVLTALVCEAQATAIPIYIRPWSRLRLLSTQSTR